MNISAPCCADRKLFFRPLIESTGLVASASFVEDTKANAVGYELLARGQLAMRAAQ